ncbi:uncharacterized protein FN964_010973 [Alca torda]
MRGILLHKYNNYESLIPFLQGYQPQGASSYGQGSQGSQSYGQGYRPQGASSYGQQSGSASSGGSSGCGQGYSYDSNPCHQDGSQGGQGGSSYSQNYGGNQGGSFSQNYGGGQGGSSSDTYYDGQDSQDSSDDNPNACDDNDTTYSANGRNSGCANKKVVARDTSHVLSRRDYDAQNESSTSNSSHTNVQGGSLIATGGGSNSQGGCICLMEAVVIDRRAQVLPTALTPVTREGLPSILVDLMDREGLLSTTAAVNPMVRVDLPHMVVLDLPHMVVLQLMVRIHLP